MQLNILMKITHIGIACDFSLNFILIDMQLKPFIILDNICWKKQMRVGSFQEEKKKIYLYTCAYDSS